MDLSEFGGISVSKRPNMFRYCTSPEHYTAWGLKTSGSEKNQE